MISELVAAVIISLKRCTKFSRESSCGARLMLQLSPMPDLLSFSTAKESNFTAFDHQRRFINLHRTCFCIANWNMSKTRKPHSNTFSAEINETFYFLEMEFMDDAHTAQHFHSYSFFCKKWTFPSEHRKTFHSWTMWKKIWPDLKERIFTCECMRHLSCVAMTTPSWRGDMTCSSRRKSLTKIEQKFGKIAKYSEIILINKIFHCCWNL